MSIQVISLTEHSFCFSRDDACSVLVTTSSKHLSVSRAHFCTENSILIQYYGRKKVCWVSLKLLPFPKLYPAKYFLFFSTLLSCCLVSCWVRPIIGIIKRLKQKKKICVRRWRNYPFTHLAAGPSHVSGERPPAFHGTEFRNTVPTPFPFCPRDDNGFTLLLVSACVTIPR